MLVCKSCNIEYEEGKKFCKHCGDPLVPKVESISTQKKVNRAEEENADGKLICPNCNIIYEFGSSCIQCGSPLGRQIPPEAKEKLQTASEEKPAPVQTSQEQKIGAPRTKLICPTCKIIYERGEFCIKCESALVPQNPSQPNEEPKISPISEGEGKPLKIQTIQEQLVEAPRKKLICPACKIIYERGNSCVRCGSSLVPQTPSQEKEKPKSSDTEVSPSTLDLEVGTGLAQEGVDSEWPSLSSPKRRDSDAVERGPKRELGVAPTAVAKEDFPKTQTSQQQPSKRSADDSERRSSLPVKPKKDYRRLFLEVGGITIMALAGGYFLWSVYSHLIRKEPDPKTLISKDVVSQILPASSANPATTGTESGEFKTKEESSSISKEAAPSSLSLPEASKTPSPEIRETQNIETLLENIRQANLQKDIDLFISCYAADFKDREGKRKATLAYWKKFDYVDLSYDLKNSSISGDTAKIKVEWVIKVSQKTGKQPQKSKAILDVTLKKEEGGWKIEEVKQAG
jgi:ketosteroid isomerase-like protein